MTETNRVDEWFARNPRRTSPEVDYGQRWTSTREPGAEWRIAWNTGTGEVYAARRDNADLHVLGIARTSPKPRRHYRDGRATLTNQAGSTGRSNGPVISPATANSRYTCRASAPTSATWHRIRNLSAVKGCRSSSDLKAHHAIGGPRLCR